MNTRAIEYEGRIRAEGWWVCPECGDDGRWRVYLHPDRSRCPDRGEPKGDA